MEYRISEKMQALKPSAIREIFKALTDPTIISLAAGNPSPESFPVEDRRSARTSRRASLRVSASAEISI